SRTKTAGFRVNWRASLRDFAPSKAGASAVRSSGAERASAFEIAFGACSRMERRQADLFFADLTGQRVLRRALSRHPAPGLTAATGPETSAEMETEPTRPPAPYS